MRDVEIFIAGGGGNKDCFFWKLWILDNYQIHLSIKFEQINSCFYIHEVWLFKLENKSLVSLWWTGVHSGDQFIYQCLSKK